MTRDHDRELRVLLDAVGLGCETFIASVQARLALGEQRYGTTWTGRPVEALVSEAVEEATDLAAWLLLAEQRAEGDPDGRAKQSMVCDALRVAERAHRVLTQQQTHGRAMW